MRKHLKLSKAIAVAVFAVALLVASPRAALAAAPVASIAAPSSISYTSAHVSGEVDPEDRDTYYSFETSTDGVSWSGFSFQGPIPTGSGSTSVSTDLSGLTPGTQYFVRLAANNLSDPEVISSRETFTTLPVGAPAVTLNPPTSITGGSAHFSGTINPSAPSGNPEAFDVTWSFVCTPECPGLSGTINADAADHQVERDAAGLVSGTQYEVTLVAQNAGGPVSSTSQTFTTHTIPPEVKAASASPLMTEAMFSGSINPGGLVTTYHFEYGPTTGYGWTTTERVLPAKGTPVAVEAPAFGLEADTGYHYRLVASNVAGIAASADGQFRTLASQPAVDTCPNSAVRLLQSSYALGDCRAFELVSPANKGGYGVGGQRFPNPNFTAAPSGERGVYTGFYPFPVGVAGSWGGWRSDRTSSGWETEGLIPAPSGSQLPYNLLSGSADGYLRGTSQDQSVAVVYDGTTAPGGSLWLVRADGSRQRIADGRNNFPSAAGAYPGQPWLQGISANGRHVVFSSTEALVPGIVPNGNDILYEWVDDGGAGTLRVVSRTNDNSLTLLGTGPAELGNSVAGVGWRAISPGMPRHSISADGSRIFFQASASTTGEYGQPSPGGGPVYLREDGSTTVEVSAAATGHASADPPSLYQYLDAARDGSIVFFWANGDLTDAAPAAGGIYRFDVVTRTLSFIAPSAAQFPSRAPTALASDNGDVLYYEQSNGDIARWDGTSEDVIADAFRTGGGAGQSFGKGFPTPEITRTSYGLLSQGACPSAEISPNGRFLAVTGEGTSGGWEVLRYDSLTHELTNVSRTPTAPSGPGAAVFTATCETMEFASMTMEPGVLSDDGRHIFFDSFYPLVPEDVNGDWDAYEWNDGNVRLLGSGRGSYSSFIGADATGANAFLVTANRLAPQDSDEAFDIYDARAGGGIPLPAPQPTCEGEGCQGIASPPPAQSGIGTASFAGPPNPRVKPRHKPRKHKSKCKKKHCKKPKAGWKPKPGKNRQGSHGRALDSRGG